MGNSNWFCKVSASLQEFSKDQYLWSIIVLLACLIWALRLRGLNRGAQLTIKSGTLGTCSLISLEISKAIRSSPTHINILKEIRLDFHFCLLPLRKSFSWMRRGNKIKLCHPLSNCWLQMIVLIKYFPSCYCSSGFAILEYICIRFLS